MSEETTMGSVGTPIDEETVVTPNEETTESDSSENAPVDDVSNE